MKKKLDFVTNSSSTSFIIGALHKETSLKVPMTIEVDLSEYIEKTITTLEDLKKYWLEECCNDESDFDYIQCQSVIENDGIVYFLRCSNDNGSAIEEMIRDVGLEGDKLPKTIKVIRGESDY